MDNVSIKNNIRRLRRNANLTIGQMAVAMDISVTAYKNLESNKTKIIYEKLNLLAATLKVSPEEILLGYKPLSPDSPVLKSGMEREEYVHNICLQHDKEMRRMTDSIEEKDRIIKDLRECLDAKRRLEEIAANKL